jgi:hypothetical protein
MIPAYAQLRQWDASRRAAAARSEHCAMIMLMLTIHCPHDFIPVEKPLALLGHIGRTSIGVLHSWQRTTHW